MNSLVIWQKGGHIVLHRNFDAARCLDDIASYRITTLFGVPAMLLFMSQQPGFATADLSSLRHYPLRRGPRAGALDADSMPTGACPSIRAMG